MKRFSLLCAIAVFATLTSVSANAFDGFKCRSGLTPKFSDNLPVFHIEPFLWDDEGMRTEIIRAFTSWNYATGYKLAFQYVRGEDKGYVGDRIFQVRRAWLYQNPNDESDHFTARNISLHTSDPGQCHWYDNDIELSLRYFDDGVYDPDNGEWTLYSLMLHEIGHAIGIKHNKEFSVVNLKWWDTKGLFGYDIQFARELYDAHVVNIPDNMRVDNFKLDENGGLRNYYNVKFDFFNGLVQAPYTVTNTGTEDIEVVVVFLYSETGHTLDVVTSETLESQAASVLELDTAREMASTTVEVKAGETVTGYVDIEFENDVLTKLYFLENTLGFKILTFGEDRSDDLVVTY